MTASPFRINAAHDADHLAALFRVNRRLHIPSFLEGDGAERLLDFLRTTESWKLVLNSDDKLFELDRKTQAALTTEQQRQLDHAVFAKARHGFQYRYETVRVPDSEDERKSRGTLVDDFARFMSDEPALSFFRTVVGEADLTFADAQATAYGPGHFLTSHNDEVLGKRREAAFVVNLSKNWSADWGGLLTFHEPKEAIAEAFIPKFNSLNLFAVPQLHSVTIVAPFAPRRRYSVTGWLRTGPKP